MMHFVCIRCAQKGYGMHSDKKRVNIYLSLDTIERLKQYAWENHTSVSHAITEWIWHAKVKNEQLRGQTRLQMK